MANRGRKKWPLSSLSPELHTFFYYFCNALDVSSSKNEVACIQCKHFNKSEKTEKSNDLANQDKKCGRFFILSYPSRLQTLFMPYTILWTYTVLKLIFVAGKSNCSANQDYKVATFIAYLSCLAVAPEVEQFLIVNSKEERLLHTKENELYCIYELLHRRTTYSIVM